MAYSVPSIFSDDLPQFSLEDPSLTAIADSSLRVEAIWNSEDLLNFRGGFQRGIMDVGILILPVGWVPVGFTTEELIAYTFVERIYSGGCWIVFSSVNINCWCLDLPSRIISGR